MDNNLPNNKKQELIKEIKKLKKERTLHTFLNILAPSASPNPGAAVQLFSYIGIIGSIIVMATGSYGVGNIIYPLFVLGGSTVVATACSIAAYTGYRDTDYLNEKKLALKALENNVIDNTNSIASKSNQTEAVKEQQEKAERSYKKQQSTTQVKVDQLKAFKKELIKNDQQIVSENKKK